MTFKLYVPQPGTIPAKVLAYLQAQPPGTELASRPLLEAIGAEAAGGLHNYLHCAVNAGALVCRQRPDNRRMLLWSLGDGTPLVQDEPPAPLKNDDGAARPAATPKVVVPRRKKQRLRALPADAAPRAMAAQLATTASTAEVAVVPAAASVEPLRSMRMAVWSTGELQIDLGVDRALTFGRAETQALAQYLADHTAQIWAQA